MNRRQKIIISITGIFIVLLALVGLTYAYFLTRITGNENDKSISVTTANLELVYGDNSAEIIQRDTALMPTAETDADDAIGTKTFTVTNNGNDSSYVVIIDNVSVTKASDGSPTSFVSNDFRYTLTCSVKDKSGNVVTTESCNDVESLSIFPIKGGILVGNDIPENRVHEYILTLWYIDTELNQSDDMGKTLQARVNISDVAQLENPFKTGVTATDNVSLAYNIIKNAKENKNGTRFVNIPPTKVAEEISTNNWDLGVEETIYYNDENVVEYAETEDALLQCYYGDGDCDAVTEYTGCDNAKGKYVFDGYLWDIIYVSDCENGKILTKAKYEKVLSTTPDDYGTSYYFRGNVEDNYVNFAGMCWRIVRIAGDGSIKLILEDQYTTCDDAETETTTAVYTGNWNIGTGNYGYERKNVNGNSWDDNIMNYLNPVTNNISSMVKAFYDFQTTKLADYTGKLKAGDWCLGDKAYTGSESSGAFKYTLLEQYDYSGDMYYDAFTRLTDEYANGYQPTLKCNGTVLDKFATVSGVSNELPMYVSTITADEIVYAGGKSGTYNNNYFYYLMNDYSKDSYSFWTLSPHDFSSGDRAFLVYETGSLINYEADNFGVSENNPFRPAVSLAPSAAITGGEGTLEKPYVIE